MNIFIIFNKYYKYTISKNKLKKYNIIKININKLYNLEYFILFKKIIKK